MRRSRYGSSTASCESVEGGVSTTPVGGGLRACWCKSSRFESAFDWPRPWGEAKGSNTGAGKVTCRSSAESLSGLAGDWRIEGGTPACWSAVVGGT